MIEKLKALPCAVALILASPACADDLPDAPDLMTFATGVLPVSVSTGEADLRTGMEQAIAMIDGNPVGYSLTPRPTVPGDRVEIVYALPAPTRFDRFAVPNVLETPSPSQTFVSDIAVWGASEGPDGPYVQLASGTLVTHKARGEVTELVMAADPQEVLWVKVTLSGGINVDAEKTFLEFSELIGNGTRAPASISEGFDGVWRGRGVKIELAQEGPTVKGCYDGNSLLEGTVDGSVLRAIGEDPAGVPSHFILIASSDGALRGLRSTNGAPFRIYDGDISDAAPACLAPEPAQLGCGSVLHGIGFDFDSDVIRSDSQPVLQTLFNGLNGETSARIEVVGHSSSEGAEDYNRDLSRRRAASVVNALVALGLDASRLSAVGRGEDQPIASNDDEAGRSLNRRVEIICAG